MGQALIQANTRKRLVKKQKEFASSAIAQFNPVVVASGYNEKTRMYFVEYKYNTSG